jgi:hypothetical protein
MGAWTEIVDYTVPSNTTSVVLNNFGTITKDDFIKVVATIGTTNADTNFVSIYANSDTSGSNYHQQALDANGTSVTAFRDNDNYPIITNGNSFSTTIAYIKLSENDKFNVFVNGNTENGSSIRTRFQYVTSVNSFTSGITSLTFETTLTARPIASGSRIQIYRLKAEKVADITVASATTQVEIPDLNITKDNEYLLLSEPRSSTGNDYTLAYNDNTTLSNYYSQAIFGSGSTPQAFQRNYPKFSFANGGEANRHWTTYTHIKLSEIGAFTFQSYQIRGYIDVAVKIELGNYFGSSIAENITSITKLTITGATNGISAGSRFMLYKLY